MDIRYLYTISADVYSFKGLSCPADRQIIFARCNRNNIMRFVPLKKILVQHSQAIVKNLYQYSLYVTPKFHSHSAVFVLFIHLFPVFMSVCFFDFIFLVDFSMLQSDLLLNIDLLGIILTFCDRVWVDAGN